MRWGRTNRKQQESSSTEKQKKEKEEKKNSSLSELLSFAWLSKFRSKSKTHNNSALKSPSCRPEFGSKNSPQGSPCRLSSHDQAIVPRRRSVGDEDLPILNQHRRHHSVGGDHVCFATSMTLGHAIPFSVIPKQNRNIPPVPPFYQKVPNPGLYPHKVQRRTKLKTRLIVTSSIDDTHRRSFNGKKTQLSRYSRASARSLRQGRSRRGLEKFAVVKRSSEPERDFKKSMLEMIVEKGIRRPKELERLLACYLTLNADEHYDVIVKVFRQVCFEINRKEIGGRL